MGKNGSALLKSRKEAARGIESRGWGVYLKSFYFLWNGIKIYTHVCASAITYVA